jgi:hypothetical protein
VFPVELTDGRGRGVGDGRGVGCLRKWLLEFRESRNLYENGSIFAKFRVIFHKIRLFKGMASWDERRPLR